ncbi:MAG: serine protease [Planctomycetaceae bacterium]|nr:serine protease [Planctomycetaceae bacterium]
MPALTFEYLQAVAAIAMHLFFTPLRFITQGCLAAALLSAAVAAEESAERPLPNVVRVIAFDYAGQSFGSGSYIGTYKEYGIVITNRHVVADAEGLVHVHFPCGFSTFGAVIQSDAKWDLALVAVSKPPESVSVMNIAPKAVQPGEPIWIAGYGGGKYRIAQGQCTRYLTPDNPTAGTQVFYEIMEVMIASRYGDSGGPILNVRGELAGVLFGSDMVQFTAGSYSGRVNRFLNTTREAMQRLPERPETFFALIETDGPKYSLQFSSMLTPSANRRTARPANIGDNIGSRSAARKQDASSPSWQQPLQQSPPLPRIKGMMIPNDAKQRVSRKADETAFAVNLPVLPANIQPAVWSDAESKVGSLFLPSKGVVPSGIVQTGITQTSISAAFSSGTAFSDTAGGSAKTAVKQRHYGMKLFADKRERHWTLFLAGNIILGIGLVTFAVRLLNAEQ